MAKRYFNWKLAIVLLIGFIVLAITAFGLRRWQRANRADRGLIAGNKAYDESRWEDAAKNLGRYLALKGNDIPILLKYADAQLKIRPFKRNNILQALNSYRAALRADNNNRDAVIQLAGLFLNPIFNTPGEAELITTRYLETNQDPEIRRLLAAALANQRKFNEAAAELKSIIAQDPNQVLAYGALGRLIEQRREISPEPPEHWFNEAIKNNPSSALAYISRAGFYVLRSQDREKALADRSQDREKALADLEQAEKLDLSDPSVRLNLANVFINANILDKAEQHLTVVQKATPADQLLWRFWAQLALQSGSKEKMAAVAENALKELASQPWDFMPTAAELFIQAGRLDRAADCILQLRQMDIDPGDVAFLEGLVADQNDLPFEAVKCWQRAIQLDNKSPKSPRVRLALASVLARLGDTQSALRQLRTLVSENTDLSEAHQRLARLEAHLRLARLLAQTGNWAETIEQTRIAMQLSPDDPNEPALLHLQARMQLLAASSTPANDQSWQEIENQLSALQQATKDTLEVKLTQLRLAIYQSNFAGAESILTQLKQDHPSQLKVALAEVELLAAQQKIDDAILKLNQTINQFPDSTEPVKFLALLLAQQNQREKCQEVIKNALTRIQLPLAQRELGLLLAELYASWRQTDQLYPLLIELAHKLPNDILIKRWLLSSEQVAKDTQKSQQLIDEIKSLEGDSGWQWRYEQAKAWFSAANFKDRYPQIIPLLQENLLANPDDQASLLLLAATYDRGGDIQMALSTYRQALDRSPRDLRVIVPAVAALSKAKEDQEVEQILNRASQEKLYHPQLQQFQLESYLRRGQLSSASDILEDMLTSDPNNQAACFSLALLKIRQNKFDEAAKLLDNLRKRDPSSLEVMVAQIQLNLRQKKPQEAIVLCNQIVNNLNNASAYIIRARTFASLGQPDKATEDFNHAVTIEPNNVETWAARSDFYFITGRSDKAQADIQQALSLAPDNIQVQKRAVSLLFASGNPDKISQAKSILDKSLESNPTDTQLQLIKARGLLAEGTAPAIENATQILQKITEEQPKEADAWALLGEISLRQGQPGKTVDTALRGLVHKPNDKTLLLLKARGEAARSPILAIPTLKELQTLDPNDVNTAILLANTYIAAGEPEKAVELLRNQLTLCTDATRRRCNISFAIALYKTGDKIESQKIFDSLLNSEPNDPAPILAQARLLKDDKLWNQVNQIAADWFQKHPNDTRTPVAIARYLVDVEDTEAKKTAEEILNTVISKDPNCIDAMSILAMHLQLTERSDQSARLYQQILNLEPNNPVAINNLAWILCEEQSAFQKALELAEKGLKIAPNYIDLIDTRGVVYYRLGDFNKSIQDFTTCVKLYPKESPSGIASRFHLARAIAALRRMRTVGLRPTVAAIGEKDKVIEYLNQVLNPEAQTKSLSPKDLAEARRLLEELLKEGGSQ
jgi:tetratricopeptide (TPR) repeat protein